jgi:hypothetical protein
VNNSSHAGAFTHDTDKIKFPWDKTPTGYVTIDEKELNPQYKYCIINMKGNCMDSDLSPLRIKDGDKILIHEIQLDWGSIASNVGKLVCFLLDDGICYASQLFFMLTFQEV